MADLRIGALRSALGWSQMELARASGIARRSLARFEKGERSPTFNVLCRLAKAMDVPVLALFIDNDCAPWSHIKRCGKCHQLCYEGSLTLTAAPAAYAAMPSRGMAQDCQP